MKTKTLEILNKIGNFVYRLMLVLLIGMIGVGIGVAVTLTELELDYRENPTVDEQHESIMLDKDYIYCPYCGEKLERGETDGRN